MRMELVNMVEIEGKMYFFNRKPSEKALAALIRYDSRYADAEVLEEKRAYEIRRALTVRSAEACNYKLARKN